MIHTEQLKVDRIKYRFDTLARFAVQVKMLSNKTFEQTGSRFTVMHMITSSVMHFCLCGITK